MFPGYVSQVSFEGKIEKDLYLKSIPAVRYLMEKGRLTFNKNVSFLVGENGTGKSTLLEAIAVAYGFNAEGGTVNFNFSTNNTHSELYKNIRLGKKGYAKDGFFLRSESVYNVATYIEDMDNSPYSLGSPIINSYGGVSLHEQSHGESFMAIVMNRFGGHGLYILDEPEAALSPMRIMELMVAIDELVKKDSQFIISTHSPMLMAFPDADVFELSKSGIEKVDYRQTEHFKVTKEFLDRPERMLKYLLDE